MPTAGIACGDGVTSAEEQRANRGTHDELKHEAVFNRNVIVVPHGPGPVRRAPPP